MDTNEYQTEVLSLLREIRDQQREGLRIQKEHAGLAREQLDRSRRAVEESITLQREALSRQRSITRIAVPAILLCIALIAWLIVRWL